MDLRNLARRIFSLILVQYVVRLRCGLGAWPSPQPRNGGFVLIDEFVPEYHVTKLGRRSHREVDGRKRNLYARLPTAVAEDLE